MVNAEKVKGLLTLHGKVRSQPPSNWTGPFQLPSAVEQFYQEVGPVNISINAHGNSYFLPSLAGLWKFQSGYSWNSLTRKPIEDWNADWLVVADAGGDPFIFDRSSETVLHAYHGAAEWNPLKMFSDLNTMAACLAQLGTVMSESRETYRKEDGSIHSAHRHLALAPIQDLLGAEAQAETILKILSWE